MFSASGGLSLALGSRIVSQADKVENGTTAAREREDAGAALFERRRTSRRRRHPSSPKCNPLKAKSPSAVAFGGMALRQHRVGPIAAVVRQGVLLHRFTVQGTDRYPGRGRRCDRHRGVIPRPPPANFDRFQGTP